MRDAKLAFSTSPHNSSLNFVLIHTSEKKGNSMIGNKLWAAMSRALAVVTVTLIIAMVLVPGAGGQSNYKILHRFYETAQHPEGASPYSGLTFDAAGNLYGTTIWGYGGACMWHGCGSAFQLAPKADGSWTYGTIYGFSDWGAPGAWPASSLVWDTIGNLYGTTEYGSATFCGVGPCGGGVVFKLTPNSDGTWTESVPYNFTGGEDGAQPVAGLIFDAKGNLYGTTTGAVLTATA